MSNDHNINITRSTPPAEESITISVGGDGFTFRHNRPVTLADIVSMAGLVYAAGARASGGDFASARAEFNRIAFPRNEAS